jgi:aminocarboxymuconate-semialdehyde decarboxylase
VHDAKALQFLIDLAGIKKVCLGTDYPFPLGETVPGKLIEEMNFDEETKNNLLWNNACEWLGRMV